MKEYTTLAAVEKEEGDITRVISSLERAVAALGERVEILSEQLSPVRRTSPTPVDESCDKAIDMSGHPAIALRIAYIEKNVDQQIQNLRDLARSISI